MRPHLFIITRCRVSFALCCLLAFFVDAQHASHITIADPPCLWGCPGETKELPI